LRADARPFELLNQLSSCSDRPNCLHFFKPVQAHRQLADLLMQRRQLALVVVTGRLAPLKELGQAIPDRRLPLAHQHRMHLMRVPSASVRAAEKVR